jgi:hypothetical protein
MDKLNIHKTMQFPKTSTYYSTYLINALKLKKKTRYNNSTVSISMIKGQKVEDSLSRMKTE